MCVGTEGGCTNAPDLTAMAWVAENHDEATADTRLGISSSMVAMSGSLLVEDEIYVSPVKAYSCSAHSCLQRLQLPLPCVSTVFVAKTLPFRAGFQGIAMTGKTQFGCLLWEWNSSSCLEDVGGPAGHHLTVGSDAQPAGLRVTGMVNVSNNTVHAQQLRVTSTSELGSGAAVSRIPPPPPPALHRPFLCTRRFHCRRLGARFLLSLELIAEARL